MKRGRKASKKIEKPEKSGSWTILGRIGTGICAKMSCLGRVTFWHNVTLWHGRWYGKVLDGCKRSAPFSVQGAVSGQVGSHSFNDLVGGVLPTCLQIL
ncbi:hypothetical protein [Desulfosporosinus metallidurans]|uniref:hypothetical protein n=1 Tax=Desulfosporosinus metallidurans TaxID=1888891 RepID=UPI0011152AFC|nr:hypothetical protein [Desulfosporosinus metallidurans]